MTDSSFEKISRLLSVADFTNLKIGSAVFKKPTLIVYFKPNTFNHSRLGISVSKKVGNSPTRNRFKRLLRELFRKSDIRYHGFDILLVVSFTKTYIDSDQIEKETALLINTNDFFSFLKAKQ